MTSPEEEGGWHASNASNEDDLRHDDFNDHLYHDGLNDDFKIDLHKLVSMMIFTTMISLLIIIMIFIMMISMMIFVVMISMTFSMMILDIIISIMISMIIRMTLTNMLTRLMDFQNKMRPYLIRLFACTTNCYIYVHIMCQIQHNAT